MKPRVVVTAALLAVAGGGCSDGEQNSAKSRAPRVASAPDLVGCHQRGAERGRLEYRRRYRRAHDAAHDRAYGHAYAAAYKRAYAAELHGAVAPRRALAPRAGQELPAVEPSPIDASASPCERAHAESFAAAVRGAAAIGHRAGRRDGEADGTRKGLLDGVATAKRRRPKPIRIQAEDMAGPGQVMTRTGADTLLLDGQSAILHFRTRAVMATYDVFARYSNDNLNDKSGERVRVSIDHDQAGRFLARDTGDGGFGWDKFIATGDLGNATLTARTHVVQVHVMGGDGYGVEIDWIRLVPRG